MTYEELQAHHAQELFDAGGKFSHQRQALHEAMDAAALHERAALLARLVVALGAAEAEATAGLSAAEVQRQVGRAEGLQRAQEIVRRVLG